MVCWILEINFEELPRGLKVSETKSCGLVICQNFTFFSSFVTWSDLWWRVTSFQSCDVKSLILMHILLAPREIWQLTRNDPKFEIWLQTEIFTQKDSYVLMSTICDYLIYLKKNQS